MTFIWSRHKYATSLCKHGIDFKQITTIFFDDDSAVYYDQEGTEKAHQKGYDEDRFLLIGYSVIYGEWVIISFTVTVSDEIRIISARKAKKKDLKNYQLE